jgi:MFS family permease
VTDVEGAAEVALAPVEEEPSGLRIMRHRNVWPYLAGTLASGSGSWFQNVAQALLVYELTHSTFLVGVVSFAQFFGTLALAPWAGAAADHFDRKRLMIVTQVLSIVVCGTLALLSFLGLANAAAVILLAGALGIVSAFGTPAMLSMVPLLVPDHEIRGAIALNAATYNLARAVGPVLGAVIVEQLGYTTAFGLNALSYLALIAGLLAVTPREQPDRPPERPKLRESITVVRGDVYLVMLLVAVMVVAIVTDPVTTLTPGFVDELFHRSEGWVGVLIGGYGVGAVLAALRAGRARDPRRTLAMGLTIMGVGTLLFALAPSVELAVAGMVISGYGYLTSSTTTTAALQLGVEPSQRGRIMALWSVAFVGVRPFAALLDGGIASGVSLRAAGVVFAVPAVVMAGLLVRPPRPSGR